MKPITRFVMAAFAATALIPAIAFGQAADTRGFLTEPTAGGQIVRSGFGLCWHTSDWTPGRTDDACDPVAKPVAVIAPPPLPKSVAAAPPPVPAPVVALAPKSFSKGLSFSGDALFAFDRSVLKPEGKVMLDGLVSELNGATTYDTITVTGHTDRFGSNSYNQKLSERRAHAVKEYLVIQNVQANRITAEGKGETQPITKAGDCLGAKSTKVVACLQPDRHVDVEMTGTKIVTGSN